MKKNNRQNTNLVSNVSIRRDEFDRPLRRPTTPMTNLSSTSNSQVFTNDRKSIASRIRPSIPRANTEKEKEYILRDNIEGDNIRPLSRKIKEEKVFYPMTIERNRN
jgi:hypothetical protein